MRSKPLKSTITAAAVSAVAGREGVCDSTCSRKSVAPSAVHAAIAKCAPRKSGPLADERGGQVIAERCPKQLSCPSSTP